MLFEMRIQNFINSAQQTFLRGFCVEGNEHSIKGIEIIVVILVKMELID
jgi:hypothetical protein